MKGWPCGTLGNGLNDPVQHHKMIHVWHIAVDWIKRNENIALSKKEIYVYVDKMAKLDDNKIILLNNKIAKLNVKIIRYIVIIIS